MKPAMRVVTWVLASSLSFAGLMQSAHAGVIGAEQLATAEASQASSEGARAQLLSQFDRTDVQAGLQARGVDLAQARARVAALTDAEAQLLVDQIDTSPAGASDLLGALLFIFVLLLVTDILGLTKVFPFTRSAR
ncbi:MAG TPA: PA2779 family protein [Ideonella sp.]|uniref:PA2779 family protein n=1 Tax=Ideonella sp. TaxID=1929293 RepID=UPI002E36C7DC|nr:PA2779 family protein [Ideonella sp.]HEX5684623.1 PA2779 family protein [Ideonella sp.]